MALTQVPIELSSTPGIVDNSNATAITIDSSENVGIGTSSPTTFSGFLTVHQKNASGNAIHLVETDGGVISQIIANDANSGEVFIGARSNHPMLFTTNDTERMRIDASGNVGISNSSPAAKLDIVEATSTTAVKIKSGTSTNQNTHITMFNDNDGGTLALGVFGSGATTFGTITATDGFITSNQELCLNSQNSSGAIKFGVGSTPTERMRLNSVGDWMVSNTVANVASNYSTQGGCGWVESDNHFEIATTSNTAALEIGKNNANDGAIITFRKQSTPVGSIGAFVGYSYIGNSGTQSNGIIFTPTSIEPFNSSTATSDKDGDIDLGAGNQRFKDLFLSGVAYATYVGSSGDTDTSIAFDTSDTIRFSTGGSERMRVSSGFLLVGTTTVNGEGITLGATNNYAYFSRASSPALFVNRNTNNGALIELRKSDVAVGRIGTDGSDIYIGSDDCNLFFFTNAVLPVNSVGGGRDNAIDLGASSTRFQDIYATNGTIQTSDRNEKQDIEALSNAEQRVAVAAKGLLRKFRWKSAVAEKGDEARIHFGIIAQDLQDAFTAEGLDAGRYAMFINSTWTDEETGEERSRMGVRYSELLAFIIAAT
jgi:uncharacterized protein YaiE (UPF0345 family)